MEFIDIDKGKIIKDKYKIIKRIERGSFGKVYLVEEIDTHKQFAIKKSIKEDCKITKNEIRILKELSKKKKENKNTKDKSYIIDIIDSFQIKSEDQDFTYIVLEYMPNETLFHYFNLKKNILERYTKFIFLKILKGVQEIHNAGFCHLDLKLSNILLDEKYNPIICDFGYAVKYSSKLECYQGTLEYAPLEVIKNIPFDGIKADIFSLGVILFYILTRKKIFDDKKMYSYKYNKKEYKYYKDKYYQYIIDNDSEGYWKINKVDIDLSDEFKNLIFKMISYIPEKRPSIKEILNDPWMAEVTGKDITDEEKKILEDNVFKEFQERDNIIKERNKKDNSINNINKILDKISNFQHNKSVTSEEDYDYFTQDFIVPEINEDSLDMEYYIKINGFINPKLIMNKLSNKLKELKIKNNDNNDQDIFIHPSKKGFKIDLNFEENEVIDMPEELIKAGFHDYSEYKNAFHCQDLSIRIKLFKTNDGYLLKVYKKEGSFEEFNEYLKDIMKLIKEIFE